MNRPRKWMALKHTPNTDRYSTVRKQTMQGEPQEETLRKGMKGEPSQNEALTSRREREGSIEPCKKETFRETSFSADLGGSSKYSSENFRLRTDVEKGSLSTANGQGLAEPERGGKPL